MPEIFKKSKNQKMKLYLFLVILMITTMELFAQNEVDTTMLKAGSLGDIVVTAQFEPQSVANAVYKVKVIHASSIHHKGANSLSDLLQEEMNIDLAQNSVFGSNVEVQGISKENIKILIDGVPVIGRLNGIIDLSQINLSNVERVEIIEGPVSVFYGTDAMGGIMNLITKKDQRETLEGSVTVFCESINAKSLTGNIGYQFGKSIIRMNGGIYQFGGLSTLDSVRSVNWPKRNDYFGDIMFGRDIGKLKLIYNGHLSQHDLFTFGDPSRHGKIQDINYFTRRIDNSLSLNGQVWGDKYLDMTTSYLDYQRYHDSYDVDPITSASVLSTKDTQEKNIVKYRYAGVKASLGKHKQSDMLNYMLGIEVNSEESTGERILDKKQSIGTSALFSSFNYKLLNDDLELQPGVRYTYNTAYGSLMSPAFNAKLNLASNQKLRFSYARGFRAPTIKELYLDFHLKAGPTTFVISGNKDLEVEKSHSFNLQYSLNARLSDKQTLLIEPALFYNEISNLIDLSELDGSSRHYINVDKFKSMGGRINFAYVPSANFIIKLGYGQTGRYNQFNKKNDSDPIIYTPELTSSIRYSLQGLHLNAYYKYTGKRKGFFYDKMSKEIKETIKSDFNNLALTISKDFFQKRLGIQLGGKNLFDVTDVEVTNAEGETHSRNLQLWGRSFFAKATFNF